MAQPATRVELMESIDQAEPSARGAFLEIEASRGPTN